MNIQNISNKTKRVNKILLIYFIFLYILCYPILSYAFRILNSQENGNVLSVTIVKDTKEKFEKGWILENNIYQWKCIDKKELKIKKDDDDNSDNEEKNKSYLYLCERINAFGNKTYCFFYDIAQSNTSLGNIICIVTNSEFLIENKIKAKKIFKDILCKEDVNFQFIKYYREKYLGK